MNEETRDKAIKIADQLEDEIIRVHDQMDEALTGLEDAINELLKKLNTDDEAYKAEDTALNAEMEN